MTDTGVEGSQGSTHTGPDRIYRIGAKRAVTIAIQNDSLAGPNGITWDGATATGSSWCRSSARRSSRWTPGARQVTPLGETKGQLDGVEMIGSADSVHQLGRLEPDVFDNGTVTTVSTGLPSPADIGVDTKRNRVAIPMLHGEPGRVPPAARRRQGGVMSILSYAAVAASALAVGAAGAWAAQASAGGPPRSGDHPRRVGQVRPRHRLGPRLRGLSRAEDQGAGGDRDPRDLRPDRLGADRGRPAGQGGLRRHRARPALVQVRQEPGRCRQRPEARRRARARAHHRRISTRPTAT